MEKDTAYIVAYDVGTTGIKTCLFAVDRTMRLLAHESEGYPLIITEDGGAEQNPLDWWSAMCSTTRRVLERSGIPPADIGGISFCTQMQCLILVDENGEPVRNAMNYLDKRAGEELAEGLAYGLQIDGANVFRLLKCVYITKAAPMSVKDPVWKYKWVEKHEPKLFARVHKWLDAKEFLLHRCTGRFAMTRDSAFATMLYDIREDRRCFSRAICDMLGVRMEHLPELIESTDLVGGLTGRAAKELGLAEGTPVFGGGGDASLIGVGAGAVREGSTYIYSGTSGWVSTVVSKPLVDTTYKIAGLVGARPGYYNYFAQLETSGKCLEWVRDHLALDEIGIYLEKVPHFQSREAVIKTLYDYMYDAIQKVPPGSDGVMFTPWMHGNRCPFEDANARGMFLNIGLDTGKTHLIRAVVEGICYHMRWLMDIGERKFPASQTVRYVGGGAISPVACQIMADVLNRKVETVHDPQDVGAMGAAVVAAAGMGVLSGLEQADELIPASAVYTPSEENHRVYDRYYKVFRTLYKTNTKVFAALNSDRV